MISSSRRMRPSAKVTTRTMPQPTRLSGRWRKCRPQVTGSLTRRHAGPRNTVLLLARSQRAQSKAAPQRRTSEPWVKGSSRWIGFQQEALSTPMPRAAVASSKANGMKREWCPESLVPPATLRRAGRTETLTGQASHTSSSAKGRNKGAINGQKGLNLARNVCGT